MTVREAEARPRVWTAPVLLGALSAIGLIAALVADGIGDAVAWVALGIPIAVSAWYGLRTSRRT